MAKVTNSLNKAIEVQNRPISDDDFDTVLRNFNQLARAIESKDSSAINKLAVNSDQSKLFVELMTRFEKFKIDVLDIRARNSSKSITATLRIENMVRTNGDLATPSQAYQDREIASRRVNGKWSKIEW